MLNVYRVELIFVEITGKLDNVLQVIEKAKTKRTPDMGEVKLIAVSKTKPVSEIQPVVQYGIKDLGENRVQEIAEKVPQLPADVNWHLIGHLQTNKVKYIVDKVAMIHSLDSIRLAEEIDRKSAAIGRVMPVLVQVNMAREETKFGLDEKEVPDFLAEITRFSHLSVKGLMTVAPFVEDPEENRIVFRQMRALRDEINKQALPQMEMRELSMGMSNDYAIAIEEGATMVRVGASIFGTRSKF